MRTGWVRRIWSRAAMLTPRSGAFTVRQRLCERPLSPAIRFTELQPALEGLLAACALDRGGDALHHIEAGDSCLALYMHGVEEEGNHQVVADQDDNLEELRLTKSGRQLFPSCV